MNQRSRVEFHFHFLKIDLFTCNLKYQFWFYLPKQLLINFLITAVHISQVALLKSQIHTISHIEHKEGNQETESDRCVDYFYQKQKSLLFLIITALSWVEAAAICWSKKEFINASDGFTVKICHVSRCLVLRRKMTLPKTLLLIYPGAMLLEYVDHLPHYSQV